LQASTKHRIDVAFLKDNVFRRNKRMIVFDMDSTLIQAEVIDELAELCGVCPEVKAITHIAMNGEIDFDESSLSVIQVFFCEVKFFHYIRYVGPQIPSK
jgi:phosphoserine phosphatase